MSELHKPGTPGPWEWKVVSDHVRDYAMVRSVAPGHEGEYVAEMRAGSADCAPAIADLWLWIERAERYEATLAVIAGGYLIPDEMAGLARVALRGRGGSD